MAAPFDFMALAGAVKPLFKEYGAHQFMVLCGIFWVMSRTRTDFLVFKKSIEDRFDRVEEKQEDQDEIIEKQGDLLTKHGLMLNSHKERFEAHKYRLDRMEKPN